VDFPFAEPSGYVSIMQKFLAQFHERTEARRAMSMIPRLTKRGRAFVAACVSVAFFWTLALSASPQLHGRIHSDANRIEHTCAATLITSGSYAHSPPLPLICTPGSALQFSEIPALNPLWIPSPFLGASIFEHAPPAHS
jgi:hypothetical protein